MKYVVNGVEFSNRPDQRSLIGKLTGVLGISPKDFSCYVLKESIDARNGEIKFVYNICVESKRPINRRNVNVYKEPEPLVIPKSKLTERPVIIGFGPAGMFSALLLARAGARPIIVERGKTVEDREADIKALDESGILNTESNYCYGEGGAGTFSDGKLQTGVKDSRIGFVLDEFVKHGAPEAIKTEAKPHIGTEYLKVAVRNIRKEIIDLGGEFYFQTKLKTLLIDTLRIVGVRLSNKDGDFDIKTSKVILAIGHSARETFESLLASGVRIEPKDFSVGVRIEHLQSSINKCQYHGSELGLPAASYKSVVHLNNGRVVYSFCMCPGGVVVNASTEENTVITNGMSYFARDGENGNSAILVNVKVDDYYRGYPLDGFDFIKGIESAAYNKEQPYFAPSETVADFLSNGKLHGFNKIKPTYKPGVYNADLSKMIPSFIDESLREGLTLISKHQPFFKDRGAVLTGFETKSSSPVRIPRDESGQSNIEGLYPCGEGASYAGGIMSAALDGLKIALLVLA